MMKILNLIGGLAERIFLLLLLALLLYFLFCEGNKAYWDYRVRKMCEADGGVKVYEKITISYADYLAWSGGKDTGYVRIPFEDHQNPNIPVYRRIRQDVIHPYPLVVRGTDEIVRRTDGKVLGSMTFFYRRDGDFPSLSNGSSFSCPALTSVEEQIVIVERTPK